MVSKSILEYINDNIKDCSNECELAYTIYILLGEKLFYSPLYVRYRLDSVLPEINKIGLDNPFVNCETWSKLYNEVLHLYGIDSRVIGDSHKLVEIKIGEMVIRADATIYLPNGLFDISSDLTNLKFGLDILYFRLIDNNYREEFNRCIDTVNNRFNIKKGKDSKIINDINLNNDKDVEYRITNGIEFYNAFFDKCNGEVERRQLFERYYPYLFSGIDNSIIDVYDDGILSKHLLIFNLDEKKYYLETNNGFREVRIEDIISFINSKKIVVKYKSDIKKIYDKRLVKQLDF